MRPVRSLRTISSDPLAFLHGLAQQGDVVPFSIGRRPAVLLNHPDLIEQVLVTHQDRFAKGPAFRRAGRLLGSGLLTAEAAVHRGRRRLASPAFHRAQMERHAAAIVARGAAERGAWTSGLPVDAVERMAALTFGIVGDVLFSADVSKHTATVRQAIEASTASADSLVSLIAPVRRVDRERRRLEQVVDDLIRTRLAGPDPLALPDLMSMLLAAEDGRPGSAQLRDDVLTLLLAGHDTIANAIVWTWTLLAEHQGADARLASEVRQVLGGRPATAVDIPALVFTRSVLAETLRLRPPAWILARQALQPHRMHGHAIEPGTLVIMSPYLVHRDARFHEDPLAFRPERWLAESPSAGPRLAYFPFGAGMRSCIGEPLAWMEGVLLLATFAQRWRLTMQEAPDAPAPRMTLRPRGPVWLIPELRDL